MGCGYWQCSGCSECGYPEDKAREELYEQLEEEVNRQWEEESE